MIPTTATAPITSAGMTLRAAGRRSDGTGAGTARNDVGGPEDRADRGGSLIGATGTWSCAGPDKAGRSTGVVGAGDGADVVVFCGNGSAVALGSVADSVVTGAGEGGSEGTATSKEPTDTIGAGETAG